MHAAGARDAHRPKPDGVRGVLALITTGGWCHGDTAGDRTEAAQPSPNQDPPPGAGNSRRGRSELATVGPVPADRLRTNSATLRTAESHAEKAEAGS